MEGLSYIIGIGLVGFLVFMAIRGINLWYFRINDIVKNQQETNSLLKKLIPKEPKKIQGDVTFEKQTSVNDPKVMEGLLKNKQ